MDLRHLKYFLAVAQELNIGRAAARLHISQPPLTRQIKALEDELGVALFIRTAKGVELTQAGEMFKEEAHNIRMLVEAGIDRVQRAGEGKLGRIDVGIFGSGIYDIIPKLLQDFRRKLPGVNVVLHTMNKSEQIEALRQRRITVAFNRMTEPEPDIGRELVVTECLYAAMPSDHPLASLKAVPLRAFAEQPFVVFPNVGRPNFVDRVVELCRQQGFEAQIAQEVGDAVTGLALVVHGTTVRPLADVPKAMIDLSCLYRVTDKSPLLKAFLGVIRENREVREAREAHDAHEAATPPAII